MRQSQVTFIGCLALFFACPPVAVSGEPDRPTPPPVYSRAETIVVGIISRNPKKHFDRLENMAGYLARHLNQYGIRHVGFRVATDVGHMRRLLRSHAIDVFSETVFSAINLVRCGGAEILLREWKKGVDEYHTVFFTKKGSGIHTIADLRGKTLVFEDRGSTSGFLFPLAQLLKKGLELEEVTRGARPPAGRVGYSFAEEELNMALWVERGLADAGAFSHQDWADLLASPSPLREKLVAFHKTGSLPRSMILVRRDLPKGVKEVLKRTLLAMPKDAEGREILARYNKVKKYDTFTGGALKGLELARQLYSFVEAEID